MSDEKSPEMEDIKIRLGDEIPVEEDVEALKAEQSETDLVEEFKKLGHQFGTTLRNAWYSEERIRFESEVREGVESFADEVNKAFGEVKESCRHPGAWYWVVGFRQLGILNGCSLQG